MNQWMPRRCSEADLDRMEAERLPVPWMSEQGRWSMWDEEAQAPIRYQRISPQKARRRAIQFGLFVTAVIVIYAAMVVCGG